MPKGHAVPEEIRPMVCRLLYSNEKLSGKELKAIIEKAAIQNKDRRITLTERKYQQMKQEMLPVIRQMKEDTQQQTWSVYNYKIDGFNISSEQLPTVLKTMMLYSEKTHDIFTNRHAKWVALLCQMITDIEKLAVVSKIYAENELLTTMTGFKDDEVMTNASLYNTVTGKIPMVSLPITKTPVQVGPVPLEEFAFAYQQHTFSFNLPEDFTFNPEKKPYISEVKEAQNERPHNQAR